VVDKWTIALPLAYFLCC